MNLDKMNRVNIICHTKISYNENKDTRFQYKLLPF